jgi:hypothetical protein
VDLRDQSAASSAASNSDRGSGRRFAWHALAVLLAAVVAWLILAAYRQPDFILDLAGMRLC